MSAPIHALKVVLCPPSVLGGQLSIQTRRSTMRTSSATGSIVLPASPDGFFGPRSVSLRKVRIRSPAFGAL
jgi:hypothetical protein